jgi:hypothetical protein
MMNQVVAGPETYSYHQTYNLCLSQEPGYDEPGGGWPETYSYHLTYYLYLSQGLDMMNQVLAGLSPVAGPESYSYQQTYNMYQSQGPGYDEPGGGLT